MKRYKIFILILLAFSGMGVNLALSSEKPLIAKKEQIIRKGHQQQFSYSFQTGKNGDLILIWKGSQNKNKIRKAQKIIKQFNLPIGFYWIRK